MYISQWVMDLPQGAQVENFKVMSIFPFTPTTFTCLRVLQECNKLNEFWNNRGKKCKDRRRK